jgi:hypothetical protein
MKVILPVHREDDAVHDVAAVARRRSGLWERSLVEQRCQAVSEVRAGSSGMTSSSGQGFNSSGRVAAGCDSPRWACIAAPGR